MDLDAINQLDDVHTLRALLLEKHQIIAQHEQRHAQYEQRIARDTSSLTHKDALIAKLKAENARLRRLQFAARSEQLTADQRDLFEETLAEEIAAVEKLVPTAR